MHWATTEVFSDDDSGGEQMVIQRGDGGAEVQFAAQPGRPLGR